LTSGALAVKPQLSDLDGGRDAPRRVPSSLHRAKVMSMPTSAKSAAPVVAKRARTKAAEPGAAKRAPKKAAGAGPEPFLRFHHSRELRARTLEVLEAVENAEKPAAHSGRLTDLVLELTDSGMDQYFLQSLKATKANFVVQQSAAIGLSGVQKVMGTVIRNIIGRMDDRQLIPVCGSIRQFMK
jgi:hypothetical protein